MTLKQALEMRGQKAQRLAAINAMETLSDEVRSEAKSLMSEIEKLTAEVNERNAIQGAVAAAEYRSAQTPPRADVGSERRDEASRIRRAGNLVAFNAKTFGDVRSAGQAAYRSGLFLANLFSRGGYAKRCADEGIDMIDVTDLKGGGMELRATGPDGARESVNSSGGYLVPNEMDTAIIRMLNEYGVARQLCSYRPMTSDRRTINVRKTGFSATPTGETVVGTAQKLGYAQIEAIARKWMILAPMSNEIQADSMVNMADEIATEMAYAFAYAEDDAFINGTGASAYNGVKGIHYRFDTVGDFSNMVHTATSLSTYATLILSSITSARAKVPAFARNVKYFCHPDFTAQVLYRLAAGTASMTEIIQGPGSKAFFGTPVVESDLMYNSTVSAHIPLLVGDFAMGCAFCDRQAITIAVSGERYFDSDQTAIRGVERFDIQCHNNLAAPAVNATQNEAAIAAIKGPIAALKMG